MKLFKLQKNKGHARNAKHNFAGGPARNATHNVAGGFTLVETLVAISIFTGSILGMLVLTGGSVSNTNYAKDRVIAIYLAQEGIEYMRNLRDTYTLFESNGWQSFEDKVAICISTNGCYINPDPVIFDGPGNQLMEELKVEPCSPNCPNFLYDESSITRKYNYENGLNTPFSRRIQIRPTSNVSLDNRELEIISTVSFLSGNRNYEVSFATFVKDWTP